jgi:hypothetical protein
MATLSVDGGGAAAALNRKLGLRRVFRAGRTFAAISSSFQPEVAQMQSGSMQFSLDPGTVAKLKTLEVEPVPFETAQLGSMPPSYGAPLVAGEVYPGAARSWGFIEGGIRLARLGTPEPGTSVQPVSFPVLTWINLGLSLESQKLLGFLNAHDERGQLVPTPADRSPRSTSRPRRCSSIPGPGPCRSPTRGRPSKDPPPN